MVQLTFYGGVNEIGGNKILLEDDGKRLLLDFGFPYKRHKQFYEEYLKPRGGAGLLDPLTMGLLPPIEGLYRDDLNSAGLWNRFKTAPLYRKLESIDGVLLTHGHLDHSAHISFLNTHIPVYSTVATAFITKAIQDSGKAEFDQQVSYFSPVSWGYPSDWKQLAALSVDGPKQQRQFCIADIDPCGLNESANQFWASSFWEKTKSQKGIASCSLSNHGHCSLSVRCFPVDHSIPGACAWGIETSSGWIIYSGDLRLHGKRGELTRKFVREAAQLKPRALILEGTNVQRDSNVSEQEVYDNALKAIASAKGLVVADFPARDMDRLLTFLQTARDTKRRLAILPKDAYLLKTVRLLDPSVPDVATDQSIVIYQDTTSKKYPDSWVRNICKECGSKVVLAEDVSSAQDQFILCFGFFDLNELPSIAPKPNGLYVFSSSEPHDEEQEIDFRRLGNWIHHFGMQGFGLPKEDNDGVWRIPENERGLHASGHACGPDLLNIALEIRPKTLIPVHSEHAEFYINRLKGSGIEVVLPDVAKTVGILP